jgi:hypothetical protein
MSDTVPTFWDSASVFRVRWLPAVATFRLGSSSNSVFARNEATKREASGQMETVAGKVTWIVDPGDDRLLRGLPAVGNRLGGAILGTRPGSNLR